MVGNKWEYNNYTISFYPSIRFIYFYYTYLLKDFLIFYQRFIEPLAEKKLNYIKILNYKKTPSKT